MSKNPRDQNVTPEQTYSSVQNLLRNESGEGESLEQAVGVCYNYLTQQKKPEWSIHLEKLVELFLDLAFETNKHSKIKDVFRSYRAITQNQHPDSLKSILEYYRDNKLQQILDEQIPEDSDDYIRTMRSIESDEASSQIILSSFNPDIKNKREQIRTNLKTVWQGYKAVIDTVRFNHKFESVYRATLKKIFEFVDQYNRKHEFKSFSEYLRSGLRNVLSKRGDKAEQQKGFYIDIEKEEVNTNNIEIRLEQFGLATKLGLWQESFQLLEDINDIIKVRKVPVKNSVKCAYFEKLAVIFKKSNYWHYHANAFFNYYSVYMTKSKLSATEKLKLADKLILSVLCIPPSTIEKNQSKESQQKIASLLISGGKIPTKQELQEMMISRGVVENSSPAVKEFWYFMFLDFDLTSLSKGLKLLKVISEEGEYKQFIELLEDILIYKQLISVAEVYQRIKYESLLAIIPLPKQKVEKVLLDCHHRKVIDFVFDEKQGILVFEDQREETNPYEQFLSCYNDIALLHEENRKNDRTYIIKKTMDFIETANSYYNNERHSKIMDYKRKLKESQDVISRHRDAAIRQDEQNKRNKELLRIQKQNEDREAEQEQKKLFIEKKVRISEIMTVKQNRIVKIGDKKIEKLTDDEIKSMDKQIFQQGLKEITARVATDNQNRNKKRFTKVDYQERQRRFEIKQIIQKALISSQQQKQQFKKMQNLSKIDHDEKQQLKNQIQKIAPEVRNKIETHYLQNKQQFQTDIKAFKQNVTAQFKKKVLAKARELHQTTQKRKKQQQERRRADEITNSQFAGSWTFGGVSRIAGGEAKGKPVAVEESSWKRKTGDQPSQEQETKTDQSKKVVSSESSWGRKPVTTGIKQSTAFSDLKDEEEEKKQKKWNKTQKQTVQEEGSWFGKKKQESEPVQDKKEEKQKFIAPSLNQNKGSWGRPQANVNVNVNQPPKREDPQLSFKGAKKQEPKKDTNKKGRGW